MSLIPQIDFIFTPLMLLWSSLFLPLKRFLIFFHTCFSIFAVLTILYVTETQLPYKSQLQVYAQKRHKELPSYDTIQSGPPHAPLFRSTVTIDGRKFESPQDYHTTKEAEFAAARVALMSLCQEANPSEQMPVGCTYFLFLWMALICTRLPMHQH